MSAAVDYAFFLHGLLLLLLAIALATRHHPGPQVPWTWLAWFAALQASAEWLGLAAIRLLDAPALGAIRIGLLIASYVALGELGRQGLQSLGARAPGRWLHLPALALGASGLLYGIAGVEVTARLFLGVPGAIVGGLFIARAARSADRAPRWPLRLLAGALLGTALLIGLSTPSSLLAATQPLSLLGTSVGTLAASPLVRCLVAALMLLGAWRSTLPPSLQLDLRELFQRALIPAGTVVLLALGGIGVAWVDQVNNTRVRERLETEATVLAQSISPQQVKAMSFTAADRENPSFLRVRHQMIAYFEHRLSAFRVPYAYSVAQKGGKLVFGPESIPEGSPLASPPGTTYQQPPLELLKVFRSRQVAVTRPYTDEYGTFVSGFAPVLDPRSGEILLVVGVDLPAGVFERRAAWMRLVPILLTLVLLAVVVLGEALLRWRDRLGDAAPAWLAHTEAGLTAICGLALTVAAAQTLHSLAGRESGLAFRGLADNQASDVQAAFHSIRDQHLATLTALVANSHVVSEGTFDAFAAPLIESASVRAMLWAPRVAPLERAAFEDQARARGLPGYAVHALAQADCDPASHDAFPVLLVSPLEGNRPALGADLTSEPARRAAIEDAIRTGLPTASAPIVLVDDPVSELGMLAVAPVWAPEDPSRARGIVAAAIRFQSLLVHALAYPDPVEPRTRVALLWLDPGTPPRLIAAVPPVSGDVSGSVGPLAQEASVVRPISFLGQTLAVVVTPGKGSGVGLSALVVGFLGLLLTASLTGLVTSLAGRSVRLDREVRERTVTLRESEGTLRAIVDSALNAIVMIDARGRVTLWNQAAEQLFGHPASEAVGQDLHHLIAPQWMWSEAEEGLRRFHVTGDGPAIGRVTELPAIRKDGSPVPVELALAPVRIEGAWHAVGVMSDLTERRRIEAERRTMEQHLVEAQKLESLGVLAGGVAHDFNNILMGMVARTDVALLKLPPGSPVRTSLEDVKQQARRAADLVRQMLAFSGKGRYLVEPLDLGALVYEVIPLLQPSLPRETDLRVEIPSDLPRPQGDATQIRQLVTNLLLNAGEALEGGRGAVTVSAGHGSFSWEELAEPALLLQPATGSYVWIEVADSGSGMDAATLQRVFEPFFSTKALGRGLGMSAVLGIVRGHHGSLQLRSQPGKGTTCRVFLPAASVD